MDDAHTTLLDVEEAPGTAFFAVYDGHGGKNHHTSLTDRYLPPFCVQILSIQFIYLSLRLGETVAKYCGEHLHKNIIADPTFGEKEFKTAIKNGFLETDRSLHLDPECNSESSGCTAISAIITDKDILYVVRPLCREQVLALDNGKVLATQHSMWYLI